MINNYCLTHDGPRSTCGCKETKGSTATQTNFDYRWNDFLKRAGSAARLFTRSDRSLAFAFYSFGALDSMKPSTLSGLLPSDETLPSLMQKQAD